jgi:hypothetical protein
MSINEKGLRFCHTYLLNKLMSQNLMDASRRHRVLQSEKEDHYTHRRQSPCITTCGLQPNPKHTRKYELDGNL